MELGRASIDPAASPLLLLPTLGLARCREEKPSSKINRVSALWSPSPFRAQRCAAEELPQLGERPRALLCLGTPASAQPLMCSSVCLLHGAGHQITAARSPASQEPLSPKTYLIFSFKVVLATPRRCCRLCLGRVGCVSFPPLTSASLL